MSVLSTSHEDPAERVGGESRSEALLLAVCALLLLAGGAAWRVGAGGVAADLWVTATVIGLAFEVGKATVAIMRRRFTVDAIAILALIGALAIREWFAGAMVAVMLATGALLEARASARAVRELSLLVQRAPRLARRKVNGTVTSCAVSEVAVGDELLVGSGEIVPVDGRLLTTAVLDESMITGEALPIERTAGQIVRSGVLNGGAPLELTATASAADSTYDALVRLVREAQSSSAPFVRLADRFAMIFVPLTVLLAGVAWVIGGSVRAVAVLVVATPCPLLLAAPIAFLSGLSQAAGRGVVVKGADALERLAEGQVMLFDKTGTLTVGHPVLRDVITSGGPWEPDEILRLAASLDQVSAHVLAGPIIAGARSRGVRPELPSAVEEVRGYGIRGTVAGRRVQLGRLSWLAGAGKPPWAAQVQRRAGLEGSMTVFVSIDGEPVGALLLEDRIRSDAPRMIRVLRAAGVHRIVLLTGDRTVPATRVGRLVGVDEVLAECDPATKLAAVKRESAARPTVMVGDGVNDAPALAAAHVGVALAAHGATASSEAADIVLTVDRVDVLAEAIRIARRSKRIAWQAVVVGMGLSLVAMGLATAGLIVPALGAVVQEGIDVLAIGIALRAVLDTGQRRPRPTSTDLAALQRLQHEHDRTLPVIEQVKTVADSLTGADDDLRPVRRLLQSLERDVLAHERADERELLPMIGRVLGERGISALHLGHAEIELQIAQVRALLTDLDAASANDVVDLRRLLYGLYATLRLHNAQENEDTTDLTS